MIVVDTGGAPGAHWLITYGTDWCGSYRETAERITERKSGNDGGGGSWFGHSAEPR